MDAWVLVLLLEVVKGKTVEVYKRVEKEDYQNCCLKTDFQGEIVSFQDHEVHEEVAKEEDEPIPEKGVLYVLEEVIEGCESG